MSEKGAYIARNMACSGNTNQRMANHKTSEGELKGICIGALILWYEGWN